jgi:DNA-binding CsgD family transcriptional regulator
LDTSLSTRAQFTLRQRFDVSPAARVEATLGVNASRTFAVRSGIKNLLAAGFEALDLLGIGLVVCGADGQLLVINQTAERIVQTSDGLEVDSDGRLRTTQECNPPFAELLQRVSVSKGEGEVALAVRRPSSKRPLTLLLRSTNGHSQDGPGAVSPAALVLILDSALPVNTVEAELRQLYGLTYTETRLAKLLMEGLTLDDCCAALGIRRTTGRMHLRNLFAKIGVRRQSELVSLLMKSIGLGPRRQ